MRCALLLLLSLVQIQGFSQNSICKSPVYLDFFELTKAPHVQWSDEEWQEMLSADYRSQEEWFLLPLLISQLPYCDERCTTHVKYNNLAQIAQLYKQIRANNTWSTEEQSATDLIDELYSDFEQLIHNDTLLRKCLLSQEIGPFYGDSSFQEVTSWVIEKDWFNEIHFDSCYLMFRKSDSDFFVTYFNEKRQLLWQKRLFSLQDMPLGGKKLHKVFSKKTTLARIITLSIDDHIFRFFIGLDGRFMWYDRAW